MTDDEDRNPFRKFKDGLKDRGFRKTTLGEVNYAAKGKEKPWPGRKQPLQRRK